MIWRAALFLVAALALASAAKLSYDEYHVYRMLPSSQEQLQFLVGLPKYQDISFWKEARAVNRTADVMVSPEVRAQFLQAVGAQGIKAALIVDNVQALIDNERPIRRPKASLGWEDYYTLEEINAWLDSLTEAYPGVVTPIVAGSSYEGREIRGVRVSFGSGNPAVVLESGIHANEWIGPAAATWILNEILTTNDSAVSSVVRNYDFYIFPSTNPDGYEYTWTTDRTWRRTRKPYSPCYGADPNRNWDFHWREDGGSSAPCSSSYAGPEPFSEVETRTLSAFLTGLGDYLQVYFSFHSYGQMLMFPYGLADVVSPIYDELFGIATRAADALATRYGTQYTYGSIVDTIYPAAGSSLDWVAGVLGRQYCFVWEHRDTGEYGMILPAEQIVPDSQEVFDSLISILGDIIGAAKSDIARQH